MKKAKIDKVRLPQELIILKNEDKEGWQESWFTDKAKTKIDKNRSMINFPSSYRAVIIATPNSGKSLWIKNMILQAGASDKPYQRIIVCHPFPDLTHEYDQFKDLNLHIIDYIPAADSPLFEKIDNKLLKTLLIFDDYNFKEKNKEQLGNLTKLFTYVSSHLRVDIITAIQDVFNQLPVVIRRMCNVWILFKLDSYSFDHVMKLLNYNPTQIKELSSLLKTKHDSIWIDMSENGKSPYPLRLNGFTELEEI